MSGILVNKHMTRVLAGGGSAYDVTWLDTVSAWLESEGLRQHLLFWTNPAFGVAKNGSNEISKCFDLGCTLLPRGGDWTARTPAQSTYSATGLNSTTPAIVGASGSLSQGYWGAARDGFIRTNQIRRKIRSGEGLTFLAVYQKSHTNAVGLLGFGQFSGVVDLSNTSGAPGSLTMTVGAVAATHSTTLANSAAHVVGGVIDPIALTATPYIEGVAGSSSSVTNRGNCFGSTGYLQTAPLLMSGGTGNFTYGSNSVDGTPTYVNSSQFTFSDLAVFGCPFSGSQMSSFNTLIRNRIGP